MTATAATRQRSRPAGESITVLRRIRPVHVVAGETVLAALLMSYALGRQSLWFDETATAKVMADSWSGFVRALGHDPTFLLYYSALRVWTVAGDSEAVLRSFSVVAAVALVPVMYVLTARLFSVQTGLVAALLTALSTTVVAQAQQARQYALVLLLVSLATLCFVRAVDLGTRASWLLYAMVAALAVYGHVFVLAVIAGHVASLVRPGPPGPVTAEGTVRP